MNKCKRGFIVGFLAVMLYTNAAYSVEYQIIDLGTLSVSGGIYGDWSRANGINDNVQIVGGSNIAPNSIWSGFLSQGGIMTNLGGYDSEAFGINNAGQIVGREFISYQGSHAVLWDTTMHDLGTLGDVYNSSTATDINNSGQIVGYSGTCSDYSIINAFLYDSNNGMQNIGTLGGNWSKAYSINDFGQVVGESLNSEGYMRAFSYQNGVMTDLGTVGGSSSNAYGINSNGQIVGVSKAYNDAYVWLDHAFLYQNGIMTDLNSLLGNSSWMISRAYGINDAGQIVGTSTISALDGGLHAFLYHDGVKTDLGTLGGNSGAIAINNNGLIIGWSEPDPTSTKTHAVLWTPVTAVAPEPISSILFVTGGTLLAGRRMFKRGRA